MGETLYRAIRKEQREKVRQGIEERILAIGVDVEFLRDALAEEGEKDTRPLAESHVHLRAIDAKRERLYTVLQSLDVTLQLLAGCKED